MKKGNDILRSNSDDFFLLSLSLMNFIDFRHLNINKICRVEYAAEKTLIPNDVNNQK